jgi:hypothetical protein
VGGNGISTGYAGNKITIPLTFAPTTVTFDPDNEILATGTTTRVTTLVQKNSQAAIEATTPQVYPNPANNEINIVSGNKTTLKTISIKDINGKSIYTQNCNAKSCKIASSNFPSGVYVVEMINSNGEAFMEKVIINHD